MDDILKALREEGYKPEIVDDEGFKPLKGKYVCRIDRAGRVSGTSKKSGEPYDFRTVKLQIVEVVSGDKGVNRFFDRSYNLDAEGTKRLLNDLFTSKIEVDAQGDEELDLFLEGLVDKLMNVSAWTAAKVQKIGDDWVEVEPEVRVQKLRIVNEFKGVKKSEGDSIPF